MPCLIPDYYADFACIKGDCRHSCCIGWEIDIDEDSLARYKEMPGEMGKRIRENLEEKDGIAFFRLMENERCPFLNQDGLCDMILAQGEDSLCHICADHPRFRNHFSTHTEMGLGLCCEAAAKLILTREEKMHFVSLEGENIPALTDADEIYIYSLRSAWIKTLQDRTLPYSARWKKLEKELPVSLLPLSTHTWAEKLLALERLDEAWTKSLHLLQHAETRWLPSCFDTALEQLTCYLLFRHLPGALDDGDTEARLAFCLLVPLLLSSMGMAKGSAFSPDGFTDLCRMYSSEIEYSDENLYAILDELSALQNS
ncbi:MAG: flagellin lysine-N-methylase [Clostridia bacterium]|nr:flagellin lysine-N-methylase [Clostridia bacterium]